MALGLPAAQTPVPAPEPVLVSLASAFDGDAVADADAFQRRTASSSRPAPLAAEESSPARLNTHSGPPCRHTGHSSECSGGLQGNSGGIAHVWAATVPSHILLAPCLAGAASMPTWMLDARPMPHTKQPSQQGHLAAAGVRRKDDSFAAGCDRRGALVLACVGGQPSQLRRAVSAAWALSVTRGQTGRCLLAAGEQE